MRTNNNNNNNILVTNLTVYGLDDRSSITSGDNIFFFTTTSPLKPARSPIQRVQNATSRECNGRIMKLAIHIHLWASLGMGGACSFACTPPQDFTV
jgi:hypothetical protein